MQHGLLEADNYATYRFLDFIAVISHANGVASGT